jgi:hypothetical protein
MTVNCGAMWRATVPEKNKHLYFQSESLKDQAPKEQIPPPAKASLSGAT